MRKLPKHEIINGIECLECIDCNIMKPLTEFRDNRFKCKQCESNYHSKRHKNTEIREKMTQQQKEKRSTPEGKAKVKEYNAKRSITKEK